MTIEDIPRVRPAPDFSHVPPSALTNLRLHLRICPLCVDERRCEMGAGLEKTWDALEGQLPAAPDTP